MCHQHPKRNLISNKGPNINGIFFHPFEGSVVSLLHKLLHKQYKFQPATKTFPELKKEDGKGTPHEASMFVPKFILWLLEMT